MQSKLVRKLVLGALFAALICVVTMFVKIPVPFITTGGYFHAGDAFIYLAASVLGGWWATVAAAVGSVLADLLLGAIVYMPATFIIKGAMALVCALCLAGFAQKRSFWGLLATAALCGVIMLVGYFVYEWMLVGLTMAWTALPFNGIQFAAGIVIGLPLMRVKALDIYKESVKCI